MFANLHLPHTLIVKLLLSILIGGAIGAERELRSKSAGFRTLILICLGATLFTIFSQSLGGSIAPDRIASNIVTGIGFLGAGVIFRSDNRVKGITTAAAIWLAAALGMGIGCDYYAASLLGCVLVIVILFAFSAFDKVIDRVNQVRDYKITYSYEEDKQHKYEELIEQYGLTIKSRVQSKTGNIISGYWTVQGNEKKHQAFIAYILNDNSVTGFDF